MAAKDGGLQEMQERFPALYRLRSHLLTLAPQNPNHLRTFHQ